MVAPVAEAPAEEVSSAADMKTLHLTAICVAIGGLLCASAHAQESDDDLARAHFSSGRAYYEQGRYEDAAREFLEAYRLSQRAELLENASRAYERALLFDEAIEMLQRVQNDHPDHMQRATIEERIANLERLRERLRQQNGGGGGGDDGDPDAAGGAPVSTPPPDAGGGGGVSIPGILVLSGGAALGLVALITGAVSHTMYEDLQAVCTSDGVCPADRQGDIDTGNALALTSTVLTFVSVAAMAAGVVILIVDSGGRDEQAQLELTPNGLALRGRFR